MKGYLSNENGEIIIENEVIAQYAGHAALECFGIVGMATISMKDGIAKLLKGDSISKGVNVVIGENNELSMAMAVYMLGFNTYMGFGDKIRGELGEDKDGMLKRIYEYVKRLK